MQERLNQITETVQHLERTKEKLNNQITEALQKGIPLRQVAKAAKLSRQTIYNIQKRKAESEK